MGPLSIHGYGKIGVFDDAGRLHHALAPRVAWELASGAPVPDGFLVCHTCDNRACVRNDEAGTYAVNGALRPRLGHLFIGTPQDNIVDAATKGRLPRGVEAPGAKLGADEAVEVRRLYAAGIATHAELGVRFGVSKATIGHVIRQEHWSADAPAVAFEFARDGGVRRYFALVGGLPMGEVTHHRRARWTATYAGQSLGVQESLRVAKQVIADRVADWGPDAPPVPDGLIAWLELLRGGAPTLPGLDA